MPEPRVTVGVIGKPFGLRGDVYVRPEIDHDFPIGVTYDAGGRSLTVAASRLHSGRRVVRFDGVDDRGGAEQLRDVRLVLPRSAVALHEDVVWTADVLGWEVVDETGMLVGVLEATLDGPAHDYLVVARTDGAEVLVPAVRDLVEFTDGRIVVRAVPGLLDPDADDGTDAQER